MARTREGSTGHFGVDPEDAAGTPREAVPTWGWDVPPPRPRRCGDSRRRPRVPTECRREGVAGRHGRGRLSHASCNAESPGTIRGFLGARVMTGHDR